MPHKTETQRAETTTSNRHFYDVRQYVALVNEHKEVLVMQLPRHYPKRVAGKWVLPGGTPKPSEEPLEALAREVLEETGLTLTDFTPINVLRWNSIKSKKYVVLFKTSVKGRPRIDISAEHGAFRWANADSLKALKFQQPVLVEALLKLVG